MLKGSFWRRCQSMSGCPIISLETLIRDNSIALKQRSAAFFCSKTVMMSSNSNCIYNNLATEEALLRGLCLGEDQCCILFYINSPCVVVGRNQNLFQEVALRRARDDGIAVARRSSGGGAVYHDMGNLCLSFFTHRSRYAPEQTTDWLRRGLCGVFSIAPERLTTTSRHDLFLDGRKITGSAMRVQRDIACHHCTLLVNSDLKNVGQYLRADGDYLEFSTSSVGSLRSPVTTLQASCGAATGEGGVEAVMTALMKYFELHPSSFVKKPLAGVTEVAEASESQTPTLRFQLDVLAAAQEDVVLLDAEGRRSSRGDAATLQQAVAKLQSEQWINSMPKYKTVVSLTFEELRGKLCSSLHWSDLVKQSRLSEDDLLFCILCFLVGPEAAASTSSTHGGSPMRNGRLCIGTAVEQGVVVDLSVSFEGTVSAAASTAPYGAPLEWLQRFLNALLSGTPCSSTQVEDVELPGEVSTWVRGMLMEATPQTLYMGDGVEDDETVRSDCLALLLRSILSIWRRKNVFDVCLVPSSLPSRLSLSCGTVEG